MKKEVKIEIKGKEYTFPLGLKFLGSCLNNLNLTISDLGEKMDNNAFMWSPIVMYESLKSANDKLEFTEDEFLDLLDEDDNGIVKIGNFNRAFRKSLDPDLPEEKNKKKAIPKKR